MMADMVLAAVRESVPEGEHSLPTKMPGTFSLLVFEK
jgi:hypothetical protein